MTDHQPSLGAYPVGGVITPIDGYTTDTKSFLATPDSAGQTTVCPYGLAFWESGLCDSDLVWLIATIGVGVKPEVGISIVAIAVVQVLLKAEGGEGGLVHGWHWVIWPDSAAW